MLRKELVMEPEHEPVYLVIQIKNDFWYTVYSKTFIRYLTHPPKATSEKWSRKVKPITMPSLLAWNYLTSVAIFIIIIFLPRDNTATSKINRIEYVVCCLYFVSGGNEIKRSHLKSGTAIRKCCYLVSSGMGLSTWVQGIICRTQSKMKI